MILNHKAAIEMLVENAGEVGFNAYTFCNLHALLSENLLPDPGTSGRARKIPVDISGTVYQPLAIPQQVEEYFHRILARPTPSLIRLSRRSSSWSTSRICSRLKT